MLCLPTMDAHVQICKFNPCSICSSKHSHMFTRVGKWKLTYLWYAYHLILIIAIATWWQRQNGSLAFVYTTSSLIFFLDCSCRVCFRKYTHRVLLSLKTGSPKVFLPLLPKKNWNQYKALQLHYFPSIQILFYAGSWTTGYFEVTRYLFQ